MQKTVQAIFLALIVVFSLLGFLQTQSVSAASVTPKPIDVMADRFTWDAINTGGLSPAMSYYTSYSGCAPSSWSTTVDQNVGLNATQVWGAGSSEGCYAENGVVTSSTISIASTVYIDFQLVIDPSSHPIHPLTHHHKLFLKTPNERNTTYADPAMDMVVTNSLVSNGYFPTDNNVFFSVQFEPGAYSVGEYEPMPGYLVLYYYNNGATQECTAETPYTTVLVSVELNQSHASLQYNPLNGQGWLTLCSVPVSLPSQDYIYLYLFGQGGSTAVYRAYSQFLSVTQGNPYVDVAINSGLAYLARAYLPMPSANGQPMAVILDLPSQPIRIYDENTGTWYLVGQAQTTDPITTTLLLATYDSELLQFGFHPSCSPIPFCFRPDFLRLTVNQISPSPSQVIDVVTETYYSTSDTLQVYWGNQLLFTGPSVGDSVTVTSPYGSMGLRYVAREITRVTARLASELGYANAANALNNFMNYYGYTTEYYDPLFNVSGGYASDFLWQSYTFPDPSTYPNLPVTSTAFPYESRITLPFPAFPCAAGLYVNSGEYACKFPQLALLQSLKNIGNAGSQPPLEDALYALFLLEKYGPSNTTTVDQIEQLMSAVGWNGQGTRLHMSYYGVPVSYSAYPEFDLAAFLGASSVLSAYFGNSPMPYSTWANQAAQVLLGLQIFYSTYIQYVGAYSDADQYGGFMSGYTPTGDVTYQYAAWNNGFITDATDFLQKLGYSYVQPQETPGLSVTNTESTGVAVQALILYQEYADPSITLVAQGTPTTNCVTPLTAANTALPDARSVCLEQYAGAEYTSPSFSNDGATVTLPHNVTKGDVLLVAATQFCPSGASCGVYSVPWDTLGTSFKDVTYTYTSAYKGEIVTNVAYGVAPSTGEDQVKIQFNYYITSSTPVAVEVAEFSGVNVTDPVYASSTGNYYGAYNCFGNTCYPLTNLTVNTYSQPTRSLVFAAVGYQPYPASSSPPDTLSAGAQYSLIQNTDNGTPNQLDLATEWWVSTGSTASPFTPDSSVDASYAEVSVALNPIGTTTSSSTTVAGVTSNPYADMDGDMMAYLATSGASGSALSGLNIPFYVANPMSNANITVEEEVNGSVSVSSGSASAYLLVNLYSNSGSLVYSGSYQVFSYTSSANVNKFVVTNFTVSSIPAGQYSITVALEFEASGTVTLNFTAPWVDKLYSLQISDPPAHMGAVSHPDTKPANVGNLQKSVDFTAAMSEAKRI